MIRKVLRDIADDLSGDFGAVRSGDGRWEDVFGEWFSVVFIEAPLPADGMTFWVGENA